MEKPEGRRPHERPRNKWENNLKMDLRDVGLGHELAQDTDKWRYLVNVGNFLNS
jgi:hypothetical protein